jgi:MerR family transcriptional regulator, light-induced transcriptional regulator
MSALREVVFKTAGKLHSASVRYGGVLEKEGSGKATENGNQIARLTRTIETEVIPRLMLAHKKKGEACVEDFDPAPSVEEVAEFARIILQHDLSVATSYVELLRMKGASLESLFLNLLAPTARLLGELWTQDILSFGEVTIGLSRLQQVLRALSSPYENELEPAFNGYRALLAPTPGESHSFGLNIVDEFMRRAGWEVVSGATPTRVQLVSTLRGEWFDMVGFSLSCETLLERLTSVIQSIRRSSLNRSIGVMVGGKVFLERPELVVSVGADATATDGRDAVEQSRRIVGLLAQHR